MGCAAVMAVIVVSVGMGTAVSSMSVVSMRIAVGVPMRTAVCSKTLFAMEH